MQLPFWDDFSFNNSSYYANDTLWDYNTAVTISTGMGVNPPTLKVATFDGIDSIGKPYSVTDAQAKGIADSLISRAIRMDLVDPSLRGNINMTFFYQYDGNGEPPDKGDILYLYFWDIEGFWKEVWHAEYDTTLSSDTFYQATVPINDDSLFHDHFRFKFQNFGRLSGPYDTWHLDYVYINNGKSQYAPVYADMPDRAIATPLTTLFGRYYSIPAAHFLESPDTAMSHPSITLTNQRQDQRIGTSYNAGQPVSYNTNVQINTRSNGVPAATINIKLDSAQTIGNALEYGEHRVVQINKLPDFSLFDPASDSISIRLDFELNSADNITKTPIKGDYDDIYKPINFRVNDFDTVNYILHDYYAYDDGIAEYGAGLNQAGTRLAYQFDMKTAQQDTVVAVQLYFPHFADEADEILELQVLRSLTGNNDTDVAADQDITVTRTERNTFTTVTLVQPVVVKDKFYVGWKQNTTAVIPVGFDKNNDNGDKIFFNLAGTWEQNTIEKGSLMIRPVFGHGIVTGIEKPKVHTIFPNPNQGVFYAPASAQAIQVYSITGAYTDFISEVVSNGTQIRLNNAAPGLYLVRFFIDGAWETHKIIVQH